MKIRELPLGNLFIVLMGLYMIVTPVTGIFAFLGKTLLFHFPKIPFILMTFLFACHAFLAKMEIFPESLVFLLFMPVAMTIGFVEHGFTNNTLSHLYASLMPILTLSFGAYFYRQFQKNVNLLWKFEKLIKFTFVVYFLLFPLYFALTMAGLIAYWGLGVNGLIMVAIFMLIREKYFKFIVVIGLILLSGKRSVLIATILTSLVVFLPTCKASVNLRRLFIAFSILVTLSGLFVLAHRADLFRRFQLTTQFDIQDERSMYLATGGRWQEYIAALDYISKHKYWLWGGGFGSAYDVYDYAGEFIIKRHYSHLTPLSYILVFGSIFTFILYSFLIMDVLRVVGNQRKRSNFFSLMYVAFFINSFSGAAPFTDPLMWFFLGCTKAMRRGAIEDNAP